MPVSRGSIVLRISSMISCVAVLEKYIALRVIRNCRLFSRVLELEMRVMEKD